MRNLPALTCMALLLGCSGACPRQPEKPAQPLERVPADATAFVTGRSLAAATVSIQAFLGRVEKAGQTEGVQTSVQSRLGFDPFTADGLKAAGLSAEGPFALASQEEKGLLWVLPMADGTVAMATVQRLARDAAGADRVKEEVVQGVSIRTFSRPFGSREVPTWSAAVVPPFVVVASGPHPMERLRQSVALARPQSLAEAPLGQFAKDHTKTDAPFVLVVNVAGANETQKGRAHPDRVVSMLAASFEPSGSGLQVSGFALLQKDREAQVLAALFPTGGGMPAALLRDPEAVAVGVGGMAMASTAQVATAVDLPFPLREEEDLLGATDGHYAGALYLASEDQLAAVVGDPKVTGHALLGALPFVAMFRPAPGVSAADLLALMTRKLEARGMKIVPDERDPGVRVARFQGAAPWRTYMITHVGDTFLVGGGEDRHFRRVLEQLRKKPVADELGDHSELTVRFPLVNTRLAALLQRDLGIHPDTLVRLSVLRRVQGMAARMKEVSATLRPAPGGLGGEFHLSLQPEKP